MSAKSAPKYWRSFEQLENSPEFLEFMHREFPVAASEYPAGISRRRWMQLMGASFALASVAGCRWETEKIAPLAHRPEGYIPGKPLHYATTIEWAGAPRHLLVTCYDGRPIKIEGNPDHPGSLGASDGFTQAATLTLYDPDRSREVIKRSSSTAKTTSSDPAPSTWAAFEEYARPLMDKLRSDGGASFAVLMEPSRSLAREAMVTRLAEELPQAKFYEYSPLGEGGAAEGTEQAFGKPLTPHYHLADAKVTATFDFDLLCGHPNSVRYARDYASTRELAGQDVATANMSRLYAIESQFSVTGAAADHRLPVRSSDIASVLKDLRDLIEAHLGGTVPVEPEGLGQWQVIRDANQLALNEGRKKDVQKLPKLSRQMLLWCLADDLVKNQGAGIIAHALAHQLNAMLGNIGKTITFTEPLPRTVERGTIADLAQAIDAGTVSTLLVIDGNPAYDAPADFEFAAKLQKVPDTIRFGYYYDETSLASVWHLPACHPLETWGDAVSYEGLVSVAQPLIEPLVDARSAVQLLAILLGDSTPPEMLVRGALSDALGVALEEDAWKQLLHDGFVGDSILIAATPTLVEGFDLEPRVPAPEIEIVFTPSSSTYDGRFANNGWLQETPDFITKVVWDNVAVISPETALSLNLKQNDIVALSLGGQSGSKIELPVYILPGQANRSIGVALGYGRRAAGMVGGSVAEHAAVIARKSNELDPTKTFYRDPVAAEVVGANAYLLRRSSTPLVATGATATSTGATYPLATTQDHFVIDEVGLKIAENRIGMLVREGILEEYHENPGFAADRIHQMGVPHLWDQPGFRGATNAWGMAVDLNKCIGCNACVVACQAENNVPIVGREQVRAGREMHWIRIDRYFAGDISDWTDPKKIADSSNPNEEVEAQSPQVATQMVTCQQCETAPCEEVCPVAATTHSEEGLNDMAYNRCVGTRYCANNCPYKVRRFNYFHNTGYYEKEENQLMQLVLNPEVTVRSRGVMEKCTFCVQRIAAARQNRRITGEPIVDGTVTPACAQACATQAIVFGDLNDKQSRVSQAHADPRAYAMLTELKTKPRNRYLARVRNPHPRLSPPIPVSAHGHGEGHGDGHGGGHGTEGEHDNHERPNEVALNAPGRPSMLLDIDMSRI
jgi:MoCo/4Fe-4S cofactor protein with predicted Tat translocation signal